MRPLGHALIITDEPGVSAPLERLLRDSAWTAATVASAAEARNALGLERFDLILSDLFWDREVNALHLLRARRPLNVAALYVVFSGPATVEACRQAFLAGADDFLEKPVRPDAIGRLIGTRAAAHISEDVVPGLPAPIGVQHVEAAIKMMRKEYWDSRLITRSLASRLGVSQEHLCRLFARFVGRSPMSQLRVIRLGAASRLLCETRLSIKEITAACGFGSIAHLDHHFKEMNGCTPSQARQCCRRAEAHTS